MRTCSVAQLVIIVTPAFYPRLVVNYDFFYFPNNLTYQAKNIPNGLPEFPIQHLVFKILEIPGINVIQRYIYRVLHIKIKNIKDIDYIRMARITLGIYRFERVMDQFWLKLNILDLTLPPFIFSEQPPLTLVINNN